MKCWIVFTSLLGAAFSLPLPPNPQHPGYVNFSYEILSPLKWYQTMMKHQYPSYGYEPMSGWLQNTMVPMSPPLLPQQQLPHQHVIPKLPFHHPLLLPQQPMIPVPPHHSVVPPPPQQTHQQNPTYPVGSFPTSNQPLELPKPDQQNLPGQPLYPIQPQPPLVEERPHDPWQPAGKNKQEELD
ncbi:amelogenin, X isoform [Pelobates fuscus]|uniref:amelogenin, X isoform n=1 Tax=Pelobates fuscus TaxID=191477 RepID=UPI002FE46AF8